MSGWRYAFGGRILCGMTALTDFLLARFAHDLATAHESGPAAVQIVVNTTVKREIVEKWLDAESMFGPGDTALLKVLAGQYSWHPDFLPEWLPVSV